MAKTGLVLEGGGQRGIYTAGVLDVFMDNDIEVSIFRAANNTNLYEFLKRYDLDVLGVVPLDEELKSHSMDRESKIVQDAIKQFYFRLNLPQVRE